MRILHLVLNWVGKGTYWRALRFGVHLAQKGHQVTLMATSRRRRAGVRVCQVDGVRVVETPDLFTGSLRSGWDPWNILNRVVWLRGCQFDVVHAFEARPTVLFPALYMQRALDVPLVMDWADWFGRGGSVEERTNPLIRGILRPIETFFEERFRTWADGTTAICTLLQEKAEALGVPAQSIRLLPNGCDVDRFFPVPHAEARRRLNLPLEGRIVGYIGSIFARDAALMARAFDYLEAQQPGIHLLIIGYCPLDLRRLVRHPTQVIQTGFIEEQYLNDHLAACDVCWLPLSDSNANRGRWPLKLNDYMAAGRPVVATAVGDVAVLLAEEPIGLLVPDEPRCFAEASAQLLTDPNMQQTMGRHARQVAETRFSWTHLAHTLESFYVQTMNSARL